jgi:hypothetical protein
MKAREKNEVGGMEDVLLTKHVWSENVVFPVMLIVTLG